MVGWLTRLALAALEDASAETTVTVVAPFAAYLGAEHLRGSGVLAVLTLGLFLRTSGHRALSARGWLLGRSVWDYADFLITSLVFVLVGFELTTVARDVTIDARGVTARRRRPGRGRSVPSTLDLPDDRRAQRVSRPSSGPGRCAPTDGARPRSSSWAGMRGVVTVATALALPARAADGSLLLWREPALLVALACVLATLVVQGLTLTPLIRFLGVGSDSDEQAEVARLRRRALQAALDALREDADGQGEDDPACRAVIMQYEGRLHSHDLVQRVLAAKVEGGPHPDPAEAGGDEDARRELAARRREELQDHLRQAFQRGSDVEREVVLEARAGGDVSPGAADEVLDDIEARATRTI